MSIAKKAFVWGLFAAGGTISAFAFPVLIFLYLLVAFGVEPGGLQYDNIHAFVSHWFISIALFFIITLSLWHAAHRLRVVFHDIGVRLDPLVANVVYIVALIGTLLTAYFLVRL